MILISDIFAWKSAKFRKIVRNFRRSYPKKQRKPIHMICDIERLYPTDKSKKTESVKLPETFLKDAEALKQKIIEMTEVKNIDHNFNFDIQLCLYQRQGIKWLIDSRKYRFPCHLADERGLAKRTQILDLGVAHLFFDQRIFVKIIQSRTVSAQVFCGSILPTFDHSSAKYGGK